MGLCRVFMGMATFQCLYMYWLLSCAVTTGVNANSIYYESTTCSGRMYREVTRASPAPDGNCFEPSHNRYAFMRSIPDHAPFSTQWSGKVYGTYDLFLLDATCDQSNYYSSSRFEVGSSYPDGSGTDTELVECDCASNSVNVYSNGQLSYTARIGECTSPGGSSSVRWLNCANCSSASSGGGTSGTSDGDDSDSAAAATFLGVETLKQVLALCLFAYGVLFV